MRRPPVGVILGNPKHVEYTELDYKLAKAYHIREDLMVGNVPIYWDQSDRVAFDVKTVMSKSGAALDRWKDKEAKKEKGTPGLRAYPVPRTIDGGPLPTYQEWAEEQERKSGNGKFGQGAGQ